MSRNDYGSLSWARYFSDPFGAAIGALTSRPTLLFNRPVIRPTRQAEPGDIGMPVIGDPAIDVMDLAPIARCSAARPAGVILDKEVGNALDALPGVSELFGDARDRRWLGIDDRENLPAGQALTSGPRETIADLIDEISEGDGRRLVRQQTVGWFYSYIRQRAAI